MNKNYAILTMHIPLEIYESGKYKLHKDRMDIDMKRCEELPAKKKTQNYDSVMEVLSQMFDSTDKKEVVKEKIKWEKTESESESSSSSQESEYESGLEEDYDLESTIDYNNNDIEEEEVEKEEVEKEEAEKEEAEKELRVYSHEIKKGKKPSHLISFKKRENTRDIHTFTRKLHI
jgi:hypothetical protein